MRCGFVAAARASRCVRCGPVMTREDRPMLHAGCTVLVAGGLSRCSRSGQLGGWSLLAESLVHMAAICVCPAIARSSPFVITRSTVRIG
jgi:hypothetical protein